MPGITRRTAVAAAAVACLTTRLTALADGLAGSTLRIATYGGSWRDSIVKFILADLMAKGVNVEFTLGQPDDNLARLIAAKRQAQVPFDTIDPSALSFNQVLKAGFLAPIDYDKVPNANAAPSWARESHAITALFTADGILYNTEKFAAAGITPPARYSDLAHPKLKGHVAFPDPGHANHWNAVVALARESGGDESNMKGALDRMAEIAPSLFFHSSTDLAARMTTGDIWAAALHGGWAIRLKRSGVPIAVVYPKIGNHVGAFWPSTRAIVAGAKNMAGAHAYLDAWLGVEGPRKFGEDTGSVPSNSKARALMAEDTVNREMLLLSDSQLEAGYRVDWSKLDEKAWREQWNRSITR